jgi:hypothetical protein
MYAIPKDKARVPKNTKNIVSILSIVLYQWLY